MESIVVEFPKGKELIEVVPQVRLNLSPVLTE